MLSALADAGFVICALIFISIGWGGVLIVRDEIEDWRYDRKPQTTPPLSGYHMGPYGPEEHTDTCACEDKTRDTTECIEHERERKQIHAEFERGITARTWTPAIAIDFDGVIHQYVSPWTKPTEIHDPPVDGAFAFIKECIDDGFAVVIHTARANDLASKEAIRSWFAQHAFDSGYIEALKITAHKVSALVYIDDRGWRFEGAFPSLRTIRSLKQWNKK